MELLATRQRAAINVRQSTLSKQRRITNVPLNSAAGRQPVPVLNAVAIV
jgi:hypothetical protein